MYFLFTPKWRPAPRRQRCQLKAMFVQLSDAGLGKTKQKSPGGGPRFGREFFIIHGVIVRAVIAHLDTIYSKTNRDYILYIHWWKDYARGLVQLAD